MKLTRLLVVIMMVAVAVPALAQDMEAPRPIDALDSVWIEELTWMEVRDEIAAGKTTAIIAAGSLEQILIVLDFMSAFLMDRS